MNHRNRISPNYSARLCRGIGSKGVEHNVKSSLIRAAFARCTTKAPIKMESPISELFPWSASQQASKHKQGYTLEVFLFLPAAVAVFIPFSQNGIAIRTFRGSLAPASFHFHLATFFRMSPKQRVACEQADIPPHQLVTLFGNIFSSLPNFLLIFFHSSPLHGCHFMFSTFECTICPREIVLSSVDGSTGPARPLPENTPALRGFFNKTWIPQFPLEIAILTIQAYSGRTSPNSHIRNRAITN